jgi:hypothetical protein
MLTAGATADTQCYWDFTGIDISLVGLEQTKDLVGGKVKLIHGDPKNTQRHKND